MSFPVQRPRRLRHREAIRQMVREARLSSYQLVQPLFVTHGSGTRRPIRAMPGVFQLSVDQLIKEAKAAADVGVPAVLLFGIPKKKDDVASEAYDSDGIIQRSVRELKSKLPDLIVITDVCLCEYMSHGHCGVVERGKVLNDPSLELLARTAVSHAEAGADLVAPSDMMDGRVAAIRQALDQANFVDTAIMSYAVKYASAFYGPFREAAVSAPKFGDRRSYQMDPANVREAVREARLDVEEGADIIMVKPAGAYLDVIAAVRSEVNLPIAAFQVSGEYSMIKAAAARGWFDEESVMVETLMGIRRAGADLIITYFAQEAAKII